MLVFAKGLSYLCVLAFGASACSVLIASDDLKKVDCVVDCDASLDRPDASADARDMAADATDASEDTASEDAPRLDAARSVYATEVFADRPIAYYRLDEESGTAVKSAVLWAPDGTFTRNVTLGVPDAITNDPENRSASLASALGKDSDLSFGNNFAFTGTAPFTVECWLKPSTIDNTARHVFSKADRVNGAPTNGWNLVLWNPNGLSIERF